MNSDCVFCDMNEKALILPKVAERHLPNETEHQAVIGDSGITRPVVSFTDGHLS